MKLLPWLWVSISFLNPVGTHLDAAASPRQRLARASSGALLSLAKLPMTASSATSATG